MKQEIVLSTSLYSVEAVNLAVAAYRECAVFLVDVQEDNICIAISDIHPSLQDVLLDAFCNHVLNETILLRRRKLGGML